MKFKVGDKVKILWGKTLYCSDGYADKGEIVEVFERGFCDKYLVRGFNENKPALYINFGEDELILLEERKANNEEKRLKTRCIITIKKRKLRILLGINCRFI